MSRWTFYTAPGTCALATHIALHEAGAEFDLVKLDIAAGQQQGPDYLRVNPKGRVPAGHAPGRADRNPALLAWRRAFRRPDSRRWMIRLRLRAHAGTGQLPGLDRPRPTPTSAAARADDPAAHEAMRARCRRP